jgi:hypothetical protein
MVRQKRRCSPVIYTITQVRGVTRLMSDICIVTNGKDDDLFEIEVSLMLSEALKEAGTVLVSQKGKKTLLGGGEKDATLAHRISGGGAEKALEVTCPAPAPSGSASTVWKSRWTTFPRNRRVTFYRSFYKFSHNALAP